jgi:hypothetical protein
MTNQEKIDAAFRELWEVVIRERISLSFYAPQEYPQETYGEYDPNKYRITIYKERTSPLTVWHVDALAHELQHARQHMSLSRYQTWFFSIDGTHTEDVKDDAALELEADEVAMAYVRKWKIRTPASFLTYQKDRQDMYNEILGQ